MQCRVKAARGKGAISIDEGRPVKPPWAAFIARIFGDMPLACPNYGGAMELKEFIIDAVPVSKLFPDIARAPPRLEFDRYVPPAGEPAYGHADDGDAGSAEFNQLPQEDDAFFNQENAW